MMEEDIGTLQDQVSRQQNEIQRLKDALAKEKAETAVERARVGALLAISEATAQSLVAEQVFQAIADTVLEITDFTAMGLGIFEPDVRCFRFVALRGLPDWFKLGEITPLREGDYHDVVIRTQQPVYSSDFSSDLRSSETEEHLATAGFRSLAFIPVVASGKKNRIERVYEPPT